MIIHRDGSVTKRSKKKSKELKSTNGHTPLSDQELEVVKKEKPEIVYIGNRAIRGSSDNTGSRKGIFAGSVIRPTSGNLDMLKKEHRSFIAIIHVTC